MRIRAFARLGGPALELAGRLPNYQLEAAIVEYWPYCATLQPAPLTRTPRLYEVKESGSADMRKFAASLWRGSSRRVQMVPDSTRGGIPQLLIIVVSTSYVLDFLQ